MFRIVRIDYCFDFYGNKPSFTDYVEAFEAKEAAEKEIVRIKVCFKNYQRFGVET